MTSKIWALMLGIVFGTCGLPTVASAGRISYGEAQLLGEGTVRSFVTLDDDNRPLEIGMALTPGALINLPMQHERYAFFLPLPTQVITTPFKEMEIMWFAHGHDPGIYDVPHFHLSLFTLSQADLYTIVPDNQNWEKVFQLPSPDLIPADFVPASVVGLQPVIPTVGFFWADPSAPEFQGQGLTNGFLYTSYNGEIILYDWLLALDLLKSSINLTQPLKLPTAYSQNGYYPTTYTIKFSETTQEYLVSFSDLTWRQAASQSVPEPISSSGFLILGILGLTRLIVRERSSFL